MGKALDGVWKSWRVGWMHMDEMEPKRKSFAAQGRREKKHPDEAYGRETISTLLSCIFV